MKLSTYILDDNTIQLAYLNSIIEKNPDFNIVGKQKDGSLAVAEIERLKPEIVFFDIELGDFNGIELYKSLSYQPLLVLCTSHLEFAIEAFELDAVDYLVKPIKPEKLFKAMDKASKIYEYENSDASSALQYEKNDLFIKEGGKFVKIALNDILYIESMGNFAEFHIQGQTKKVALVSLKLLEEQLPSTIFLRISRICIINVQHIESVNAQDVIINGTELSIGKTFTDKILPQILENHIVIKRKL